MVTLAEHQADHADEAELAAVFGTEDPRNAALMQQRNFISDNHAAAAAVDADVACTTLAQQLQHVREVFDVTALVRRDRDALGVFGDRCFDDVLHAAIVAQMDDLGPFLLQHPTHDLDRGVVAVEQARGSDEADLVGEGEFGSFDGGSHAAPYHFSEEVSRPSRGAPPRHRAGVTHVR